MEGEDDTHTKKETERGRGHRERKRGERKRLTHDRGES
jgi:hypothetical protein